jgi:hypothetical protein
MAVAEPEGIVLDIVLRLILTAAFAFLVCTLGKILLERYGEALGPALPFAQPALLLLGALGYPLFKGVSEDPYVTAGYIGVMFALFVLVVFFSAGADISLRFSYILKNTVFNWLACGIVNGGVALSIFAFSSLIYELDDIAKVIMVCSFFTWFILFLNLSLAAIPREGRELTIPRLFKIIVMYVALPVYLLLIAILCAYLGKVLVTFTFPSGRINWFASFASLFFVFFVFSLRMYRHENRFAAIFVKCGGYALMPIIAVQFMAINIRLTNYGLTTLRYISVVLNGVAFVFAAVSLIKDGKFIKYMLLVLAAAALALTLTPLNLFDIPAKDQIARLTAALERNGMLADGVIIPKTDIPEDDKIAITSAYEYLRYDHAGEQHDLVAGIEKKGFEETFGFMRRYEIDSDEELVSRPQYISYYDELNTVDISGFSRLHRVSGYGKDEESPADILTVNGVVIPFDFADEAQKLYELYGENNREIPMTYELENGRLMLTSFAFNIEDGQYAVSHYEGFYLEE